MKKELKIDFLTPTGFSTTLSKNELASVLEGAMMGIQDTLQMHSPANQQNMIESMDSMSKPYL